MAIYLKYRQTASDETSVEYEIHTEPHDPEPIHVRVFKAEDAPIPIVTGPKTAANKALRQIRQRGMHEGRWPKGGMIQS